MSRPTLLPGLAVLWRGPRTLQLGLHPRRAIVLDLPNPAAAGLLDLLDGARAESGVISAAVRRGIGESDARALLDALHRHGLVVGAHTLTPRGLPESAAQRLAAEAADLALRGGLGAPRDTTPAQILRRRAQARVRVAGRGPLGVPIAVALAASGVGHVDPAILGLAEPGELGTAAWPDTVSPSRVAVAIDAISRLAPATRVEPLPRREDATFVVQVGPPAGPAALHALAHRRLAHLAVSLREGTALVGPLVPPGGMPCLGCLDLHRTDRDPAWPTLAAQLATPDERRGAIEACATATALVATGYATAEVLRYLDGETPQTRGVTVEISRPGQVRRRTWPPHPDCDCVRRGTRSRRESTQVSGG
jgi:bacteriocin biosynthesis cyclodehydratase domain-containing protein